MIEKEKLKDGGGSVGAPRKEIDFNEFEKLCSIMCTLEEVAGWFGVSEDTIEKRVKEHYGMNFTDARKIHGSKIKASLRRKQISMALEGDRGMLIWLGKNLLGQKDTREYSLETEKQGEKLIIDFGPDEKQLPVIEVKKNDIPIPDKTNS